MKEVVNKISIYNKPNSNSIGIMMPQLPIENLVFEGGGPKGLVYVGAIEELEKVGILKNIKNVGGSSAGAMTALTLGLGFSAKAIEKIVKTAKLGEFTDITNENSPSVISKVKSGLSNLLFGDQNKGRGLFLGDKLQKWVRDVIAERLCDSKSHEWTDVANALQSNDDYKFTFSQLDQFSKKFPSLGIKTICFTGTNYTTGELEVFDLYKTPDMPVDLAVRISMSLPWFFKSVKYNNSEYMDGGCLNNYPMFIFNESPYFQPGMNKVLTGGQGVYSQNLCTLGLKVDSQDEIQKILWEGAKEDPQSWLGKLADKLKTKVVGVNYIEASKKIDQDTYKQYSERTIQISDQGYSTFNFDLSESAQIELVKSGRQATKEWLESYMHKDTAIEIEVSSQKQLQKFYEQNGFKECDKALLAEKFKEQISSLKP